MAATRTRTENAAIGDYPVSSYNLRLPHPLPRQRRELAKPPMTMRRDAITILEAIVALTLMGSALTVLGQFVSGVQSGLRDRELSGLMAWELENACERIRSWKPIEVTAERIEAIAISEQLTSLVQTPSWKAEVAEITEPIRARQITLGLRCVIQGQSAEPQRITLWLPAGTAADVDERPASDSDGPDETEGVNKELDVGSLDNAPLADALRGKDSVTLDVLNDGKKTP